jgi:hypothetical protein
MEDVLARPQVPRYTLRDLLAAQPLQGNGAKAKRREARSLGMPPRPLTRLRKMCLALPEAHEVEAWGEPTFRVRNKIFAMYASGSNHHGGGRDSAWCKSVHVNQELLIRSAPDRFFKPPYVGPSGWVGVYLDGKCDWTELGDILREAYRLAAPKKLAVALGPD